jgi:hypothetical protein
MSNASTMGVYNTKKKGSSLGVTSGRGGGGFRTGGGEGGPIGAEMSYWWVSCGHLDDNTAEGPDVGGPPVTLAHVLREHLHKKRKTVFEDNKLLRNHIRLWIQIWEAQNFPEPEHWIWNTRKLIKNVAKILIKSEKCNNFMSELNVVEPDLLVRGTDPDPSIINKNSKKNPDSYSFVTSLWLFYYRKMMYCKCTFKK